MDSEQRPQQFSPDHEYIVIDLTTKIVYTPRCIQPTTQTLLKARSTQHQFSNISLFHDYSSDDPDLLKHIDSLNPRRFEQYLRKLCEANTLKDEFAMKMYYICTLDNLYYQETGFMAHPQICKRLYRILCKIGCFNQAFPIQEKDYPVPYVFASLTAKDIERLQSIHKAKCVKHGVVEVCENITYETCSDMELPDLPLTAKAQVIKASGFLRPTSHTVETSVDECTIKIVAEAVDIGSLAEPTSIQSITNGHIYGLCSRSRMRGPSGVVHMLTLMATKIANYCTDSASVLAVRAIRWRLYKYRRKRPIAIEIEH